MSRKWIVVADRSRARIFEKANAIAPEREVTDLVNPAARAHERELTTDAQGRSAGRGRALQAHSDIDDVEVKEHSSELFAKQVAEYLDKARVGLLYDRLWIIAAPKFLGLLRKKMGKEVRNLIEGEINKDLSAADFRTIEAQIADARP